MALLYTNAVSSTHKPPFVFSPLPTRHTICCSRWFRSLAPQNTVCGPKLKKVSPQSLRFTSPFLAHAGLLNLRSEIAQIKGSSGNGGACTATGSIALSAETLRWIFTGAAALLMLLKNTAINKSFLVPLLVLQAPRDVITWIRGEYGLWAAFLALLVRLFYYIPGELELPLIFVLVVITSPYQAMDLRGTMAAIVVCAGVATFLAYQHFSGAGGIKGSFKEGAFLASLAVVCLVVVPFIFLFGGF